jgi:hypothetical protein
VSSPLTKGTVRGGSLRAPVGSTAVCRTGARKTAADVNVRVVRPNEDFWAGDGCCLGSNPFAPIGGRASRGAVASGPRRKVVGERGRLPPIQVLLAAQRSQHCLASERPAGGAPLNHDELSHRLLATPLPSYRPARHCPRPSEPATLAASSGSFPGRFPTVVHHPGNVRRCDQG